MMADACDETMAFTRQLDDEAMDLSVTPAEIELWDERMRHLFDEGGCRHSGYTKHALAELQKPRAMPITKTPFGGKPVPQQMFDDCLERMRAWKALALEVVRAEWPDFQLLHSFSVFALTQDRKSTDNMKGSLEVADAFEKGHIARLAKFFQVGAAMLY